MTELLVVLAITLAIGAPVTVWLLMHLRWNSIHPCYRCRAVATHEFMGVHYCIMCVTVVSRMMAAVRHDPPFGFPGSNGYLNFPEEKKEG